MAIFYFFHLVIFLGEKIEFYDTFSVLGNKKKRKKEYLESKITKIATIAYNMNTCLRFFTFTFWYCQIWLNICIDDHALNNITKWKKEKNTFSKPLNILIKVTKPIFFEIITIVLGLVRHQLNTFKFFEKFWKILVCHAKNLKETFKDLSFII